MFFLIIFLSAFGADNTAQGQRLTKIDCSGTGPSVSIARAEALDECRKSIVSYLQTNFKSKSLMVQTETDAALHEEVKAGFEIQGLECLSPKEIIKETGDSVKVSLTCNYESAKAVLKESTENLPVKHNSNNIEARQTYSNIGKHFQRSKQTIAMTVVPQCTSIMVIGQNSRVIRCKRNPVLLVLSEEDDKIIIRSDGYKPKELDRFEFGGKDEVQVILNP